MTTAPRALERTKVKPILFSGPMVRALIDGRKAMTRRILKPQPPPECSIHYMLGNESWLPENRRTPLRHSWEAWRGPLYDARPAKALAGGFEVRMPWTPGDLLWVRETWQTGMTTDGPNVSYRATPDYFAIDAWDGPDEGIGPSFNYDRCTSAHFHNWLGDVLSNDGPWRPGIHMPKWASRLTLEVTAVKVERLQEISAEDSISEGVECETCTAMRQSACNRSGCFASRQAFRNLWDSLNAKRGYGWDDNPWIAAIAFRVHKMNVDAFLAQKEVA